MSTHDVMLHAFQLWLFLLTGLTVVVAIVKHMLDNQNKKK